MAIKNNGVTYNLGLDFTTLDTLSYGALAIGRVDLAKELLLATGMNEEAVDKAINLTVQKLQEAKQIKDQVNSVPEVTEAPVPIKTKVDKKNQ